jgi:hypothetical protein
MKEKPSKEQVFKYLDDLRDSGITNMFGSPAYVYSRFAGKVTQKESIDFVVEWMQTFSERRPREQV